MKFDINKTKESKVVGDIKNNNVSIDVNNIDFIITILSTNLYSKPLESFIRETTSNAWDSHIEAGVNEPVVVQIDKDINDEYFCKIQDFGVGLSEDRFNKIYKNIGSSTKRGSNDQIGGFGIGRFSALACSNMVNITSIHDGTIYEYLMYKDNNSVSIDLLNKADTTEGNGVSVKIPIKKEQLTDLYNAINNQLSYFENVYILSSLEPVYSSYYRSSDNIPNFNTLNNIKIKKYNNFYVKSVISPLTPTIETKTSILLGKVEYPLDFDKIRNKSNYAKSYSETSFRIALTFNIGDLPITPNREQILYSDDAIAKIVAKYDAAVAECHKLYESKFDIDYTNLSDIRELVTDTRYNFMSDDSLTVNNQKIGNSPHFNILTKYNVANKISFHGKKYSVGDIKTAFDMLYEARLKQPYYVDNGTIRYISSNNGENLYRFSKKFNSIFIRANIGGMKNITKKYIRNHYSISKIYYGNNWRKIYLLLVNAIDEQVGTSSSSYFDVKNIVKLFYKELRAKYFDIEVVNDASVPQSFIDAERKRVKANRNVGTGRAKIDYNTEIVIYPLRNSERYGTLYVEDSLKVKLNNFRTKKLKDKTLIYFTNKDKKNQDTKNLIDFTYALIKATDGFNNVRMIRIPETKVKNTTHITNLHHISDMMNPKFKLFRKTVTAEYLLKNYKKEIKFVSSLNNTLIKSVFPNQVDTAYKLNQFINKYSISQNNYSYMKHETMNAMIDTMINVSENSNYFTKEKGMFLQYKDDMNKLMLIKSFDTRYDEDSKLLITNLFLKNKLVRPSFAAVKELNAKTLFNLNPEKDESNQN